MVSQIHETGNGDFILYTGHPKIPGASAGQLVRVHGSERDRQVIADGDVSRRTAAGGKIGTPDMCVYQGRREGAGRPVVLGIAGGLSRTRWSA